MKKKTKLSLMLGIGVASLGVLASCNSFCSALDTSNFRYGYDPINTTFYTSKDDIYETILDSFNKTSNIDTTKVTKENLVLENDQGSFSYSNDVSKFEENLINEYNSSLFSINAGKIKIEKATNEEKEESRSDVSFYVGINSFTAEMFNNITSGSYYVTQPGYKVFDYIDKYLLEEICSTANVGSISLLSYEKLYGYSSSELKTYKSLSNSDEKTNLLKTMQKERESSLLANYGYLKHYTLTTDEKGNEKVDYTAKIKKWNNQIAIETGNNYSIMSVNYLEKYETLLASKVGSVKTCISVSDGFYGNISTDPLNTTVKIEGKASDFWSDWGKAFSEHGFLEGLLVYPIGTFVENLSHSFGMNGWGQIAALIVVTVVVRLLFMFITFPSTLSQSKMQELQPEIAKLNQKYPNSQTNQYDKQRLAQATMALYKKNNVHPYRSMIVLVIQFPLFICVWNALQGSASLATDSVLGLNLSASIWNTLSSFAGWPSNPGWWTALVLIILMSTAQIGAMLLPNLLTKKRNKNITKLNKSSTQDQTQKQMKIMQYVMTGFIIIMGFTLPAAMGVYWLIGALFSMFQSLLMHFIVLKRFKKNN